MSKDLVPQELRKHCRKAKTPFEIRISESLKKEASIIKS